MTDESHDSGKVGPVRFSHHDGATGVPVVAEVQWSQDQSVAFEAACDCIAHLISHYSELIEEGRLTKLNPTRLQDYERQIARLSLERQNLRVHDDVAVARMRKEYGMLVRERLAFLAIAIDSDCRLLGE